jgi:hypothetical protein
MYFSLNSPHVHNEVIDAVPEVMTGTIAMIISAINPDKTASETQ